MIELNRAELTTRDREVLPRDLFIPICESVCECVCKCARTCVSWGLDDVPLGVAHPLEG